MKYVAWLNINPQYKNHILKTLNELQYFNFLMLFFKNRILAEFIFCKKLYHVLYLTNIDYTQDELIKINKLLNISLKLLKLSDIFHKIHYPYVNKHNIHNLLLLINDFHGKKNTCIAWGPGNHENPIVNVKAHYHKHILSDEGVYWKDLLTDFTLDHYKNYAIDSFYKMEKVIVHTNGKHIYLSGFYGNVFIVGRYHENIFGISSCYYVINGEKAGRYKNKCFDIEF